MSTVVTRVPLVIVIVASPVVPATVDALTVIVAATGSISPTVATAGLLDTAVGVAHGVAEPFAARQVYRSAIDPFGASVALAGVTVNVAAAACVIVTTLVSATVTVSAFVNVAAFVVFLYVAITRAVPGATAVTRPAADTVALLPSPAAIE